MWLKPKVNALAGCYKEAISWDIFATPIEILNEILISMTILTLLWCACVRVTRSSFETRRNIEREKHVGMIWNGVSASHWHPLNMRKYWITIIYSRWNIFLLISKKEKKRPTLSSIDGFEKEIGEVQQPREIKIWDLFTHELTSSTYIAYVNTSV